MLSKCFYTKTLFFSGSPKKESVEAVNPESKQDRNKKPDRPHQEIRLTEQLEQTLAEMRQEIVKLETGRQNLLQDKLLLEQTHEADLRQKQLEVAKAEEKTAELSEALRSKASELCKAKLSEGRLTIEVNRLKKEAAESEEKFAACIEQFGKKFEGLKEENALAKQNGDRYAEVAATFEKVVKADARWLNNKAWSEPSLGPDEECEMIKSVIRDTFLEKENFVVDTKRMFSEIERLHDALKAAASENRSMSKAIGNSRAELQEVKKQKLIAEEDVTCLKQELLDVDKVTLALQEQIAAAGIREKMLRSQVADLKVEVTEIEQYSDTLQQTNDQLKKSLKEKDDELNSAKSELETLKQKGSGSNPDNGPAAEATWLLEKYEFTMARLKTSLATVEKLSHEMKQKDLKIERLEVEVKFFTKSGPKAKDDKDFLSELKKKDELYLDMLQQHRDQLNAMKQQV